MRLVVQQGCKKEEGNILDVSSVVWHLDKGGLRFSFALVHFHLCSLTYVLSTSWGFHISTCAPKLHLIESLFYLFSIDNNPLFSSPLLSPSCPSCLSSRHLHPSSSSPPTAQISPPAFGGDPDRPWSTCSSPRPEPRSAAGPAEKHLEG